MWAFQDLYEIRKEIKKSPARLLNIDDKGRE